MPSKHFYYLRVARRVAVGDGLWKIGRGKSKYTVKACMMCQGISQHNIQVVYGLYCMLLEGEVR